MFYGRFSLYLFQNISCSIEKNNKKQQRRVLSWLAHTLELLFFCAT